MLCSQAPPPILTVSAAVDAGESAPSDQISTEFECIENHAFEDNESGNHVAKAVPTMEEDPNYLSLKNLEYSMPRSRASSVGNVAVDEEAKWLSWAETQFSTIAGEDRQIDLDEFKRAIGVKEVRTFLHIACLH